MRSNAGWSAKSKIEAIASALGARHAAYRETVPILVPGLRRRRTQPTTDMMVE
jgi:hypothetical protein